MSLLDRLLDRHRFPVLPPHESATREPGEAPVVCRMIFEELCVLATGEIVCSCGDPAGLAVYGNVHRERVEDVFRGRRYRRMRRWQLAAAPGSFCPVVRSRCGGRVSRATAADTEAGRAIRVLQLEPTSRCNLRCPGCPVSNFRVDPAYRADRTATLPLATMLGVVDQLPDLEKLLFYDFGEPFLHPDAVPFLREVRRRRPDVTVHVSTNGLPLSAEAIAAVAGEALADRVVFSVDGASEGTYRRYRRGGSFERARGALAAEAGARLSFVVTHTAGASRRYVDGSPETARLLSGGDPYEALTCDARMKHLWRHGGVAGDRWRAGVAVDVRNDGRLAWGEAGPLRALRRRRRGGGLLVLGPRLAAARAAAGSDGGLTHRARRRTRTSTETMRRIIVSG